MPRETDTATPAGGITHADSDTDGDTTGAACQHVASAPSSGAVDDSIDDDNSLHLPRTKPGSSQWPSM